MSWVDLKIREYTFSLLECNSCAHTPIFRHIHLSIYHISCALDDADNEPFHAWTLVLTSSNLSRGLLQLTAVLPDFARLHRLEAAKWGLHCLNNMKIPHIHGLKIQSKFVQQHPRVFSKGFLRSSSSTFRQLSGGGVGAGTKLFGPSGSLELCWLRSDMVRRYM